MPATPAAVLTTMGKNAPSAIRKSADPSRMPKKITANGTQAVIGIGRNTWMTGSSRSETRRNQPIKLPSTTPSTAAIRNPAMTR